ncbi:hypothetical protein J2T41_004150 [Pseudomonas citronellolis]|uniref:DUF3509 domain-containing protein n=1 Tax=Pseudomonas citronellolis TaxID=53408 RepID=UPI00209DF4AA|nr:DUF3509 domain-containing protein [Pseudomonas citronellolis]MCP1644512.1 hypothetical protein [Pseudomonas citronellolis]MCP1667361.1 hypothetical protein [Pseudomonas citronellolis]MCP1698438.1 hypothetical protein [Pseudomonas citronellolis]MCP1707140.1 hypothetical protein [Pseudomonas citronellolis]MCP1798936.1 hypothetical protein [Pseudomonas citronellolis]
MHNDRSQAPQLLGEQFSNYRVDLQQRPDGGLLLRLRDHENRRLLTTWAIPASEWRDPARLNSFIERIRRDLLTAEGQPLQEDQVDCFRKRIELQTFNPGQGRHRQRKIVVAGERLRALAANA